MKEKNKNAIPGDEELTELFLSRNENAIAETDRKYGRFLSQIAKNILPDKRDREECKNDVYLRVWKALPEAKPESFKAYLVQTMRRTALNRREALTSKKRKADAFSDSIEELNEALQDRSTPETELEAKQLSVALSDFVRSLPEMQRYIFIERYYFANPVKTIAKKLSVSGATVYREIEKIKRQLKEHLERRDIDL